MESIKVISDLRSDLEELGIIKESKEQKPAVKSTEPDKKDEAQTIITAKPGSIGGKVRKHRRAAGVRRAARIAARKPKSKAMRKRSSKKRMHRGKSIRMMKIAKKRGKMHKEDVNNLHTKINDIVNAGKREEKPVAMTAEELKKAIAAYKGLKETSVFLRDRFSEIFEGELAVDVIENLTDMEADFDEIIEALEKDGQHPDYTSEELEDLHVSCTEAMLDYAEMFKHLDESLIEGETKDIEVEVDEEDEEEDEGKN